MFTKMKTSEYRGLIIVFNIMKYTGWWIWACLNKSQKIRAKSNIAVEDG